MSLYSDFRLVEHCFCVHTRTDFHIARLRGGGGANGEMANLTNEKGIAIFRHYSPFFAIGSF